MPSSSSLSQSSGLTASETVDHLSPLPHSVLHLTDIHLLRLLGRNSKGRLDEAVAVVHLEVLTAHELALAGLVGQVAADLVAVLLGLQDGDEVDAGPHLLAGEFAGGMMRMG